MIERACLAVTFLLLSLACGGQDTQELELLEMQKFAAVESLRQDIDSLGNQVTNLESAIDSAGQPRAETVTSEADGPLVARMDSLDARLGELEATTSNRHTATLERIDQLAQPAPPADGPVFTLQLLHAADMDGSTGALTNVENFSAILDGFRRQYPANTLFLSSGDNFIPGPRYFAAAAESTTPVLGVPGKGRGDIALLNAMGLQASALGNHEFDQGTGVFASAISHDAGEDGTYPGAAFPYLSANLLFGDDGNLAGLAVPGGQEAGLVAGSVAPSAVVTIGGERIGIVGATTPGLKRLTKAGHVTILPPPDAGVAALAAVIQEEVDALAAQGINKIILLSHMQLITVETELASLLEDVDIIVAGGSNTILTDETDRLWTGDESAGEYPQVFTPEGREPVLVVNTGGDYRYLGRLVVDFNARGHILPESVNPHVSGSYATERREGQPFAGRPIPEVSRIAESLRMVLGGRDANIYGRTSVYLAGRRGDVRTQETNLGSLTADANLWMARLVDPEVAVSLKNGGGIRDHIGAIVQPPGATSESDVLFLPPVAVPEAGKRAGDISQFDIEGTLRFDNGLTLLTLTAEQFHQQMEHSVGFEGAGTATRGQFPQVAGMRFSFNPNGALGDRIVSLAIIGDDGAVLDRVVVDGELSGDPSRPVRMVTVDFLANQGDGYPFPFPSPSRVDLKGESGQYNPLDPGFPDANGNGVIDGPVDVDPGLAGFSSPGGEQDSLAEYLAHFHAETPFDKPETPPLEDRRIQNLGIPGKQDTVFGE